MSRKQKQRDIEFQRVTKVLCGLSEEKHYMERYVAFWSFIAILLFPKDEIARHDLKVCAVGNIISGLLDGKLSRSRDKSTLLRGLIDHEFTTEICAHTICNLANEDGFSKLVEAGVKSMESASLISEALLKLSMMPHKDPMRKASLAKAYYLVKRGGFLPDGEWTEESVVASDASLKNYWRDWGEALPFAQALESSGIDIIGWSPFDWDGSKNFSRELCKEPDLFMKFFGAARSIQQQVSDLLDSNAKKPPFLCFPTEIEPCEWRATPLNKRQLEIMKTYKSGL